MKIPRPSLTQWIFVGMGVGLIIGWLAPDFAVELKPFSTIFLRLIKSIVAPLIFATLVVGIAGHGDLKQVGRMGVKALVYFEVVTTIALVIGLTVVNIMKPGVGVSLQAVTNVGELVAKKQTFGDVLVHVFPQSFFQAAAEGEVLQVVVFTLIFSFALAMIAKEKRVVILSFCESLAETMFKFTNIVMKYAPVGVAAAIAVTVGNKGLSVLINLGLLIVCLYISLVVFVVFVFGTVAVIARVPIRQFINAVKEPALIAFSTTSSEAALPKAMLAMEAMGVPRRIVSFVIPTGYSFNLDGTSLYLSLAAIFVAQAAGVDLSLGQQIVIVLTLMLTSKGVAGVSRAALVVLAGTLSSFGLPLEGVAVLLGVDQLMDMGRTMVNVIGNCLATVVIARWEGEFKPVTSQ
ncbi:MAG: cation:dicarboxylase symporter family transporter [Ignavibacteriales bacterium]|nr:cation:dicarboxylase symporter family transporter [Ignavibacteriales bacterium]